MTSENDITRDLIKSKTSSDLYLKNFESIFGKSKLQKKAEAERALDRMVAENQRLGLYDIDTK